MGANNNDFFDKPAPPSRRSLQTASLEMPEAPAAHGIKIPLTNDVSLTPSLTNPLGISVQMGPLFGKGKDEPAPVAAEPHSHVEHGEPLQLHPQLAADMKRQQGVHKKTPHRFPTPDPFKNPGDLY